MEVQTRPSLILELILDNHPCGLPRCDHRTPGVHNNKAVQERRVTSDELEVELLLVLRTDVTCEIG